jgi:hypothetical protein
MGLFKKMIKTAAKFARKYDPMIKLSQTVGLPIMNKKKLNKDNPGKKTRNKIADDKAAALAIKKKKASQ